MSLLMRFDGSKSCSSGQPNSANQEQGPVTPAIIGGRIPSPFIIPLGERRADEGAGSSVLQPANNHGPLAASPPLPKSTHRSLGARRSIESDMPPPYEPGLGSQNKQPSTERIPLLYGLTKSIDYASLDVSQLAVKQIPLVEVNGTFALANEKSRLSSDPMEGDTSDLTDVLGVHPAVAYPVLSSAALVAGLTASLQSATIMWATLSFYVDGATSCPHDPKRLWWLNAFGLLGAANCARKVSWAGRNRERVRRISVQTAGLTAIALGAGLTASTIFVAAKGRDYYGSSDDCQVRAIMSATPIGLLLGLPVLTSLSLLIGVLAYGTVGGFSATRQKPL